MSEYDDQQEQQREMEEARLSRTLEALDEIDKAGFHEHAKFLAGELGVKTWWTGAHA